MMEGMPIVLEDRRDVLGTDLLDVSPDGSRIVTGRGQLLSAGNLTQAGLINDAGPAIFTQDGSGIAILNTAAATLSIYHAQLLEALDTINLAGFGFQGTESGGLIEYNDG